jgi:uncharacterized protein (TIGR03435 family)
MRCRSVAVLLLYGVVGLGAQAQKPTFEVASIKPQNEALTFANLTTAGPRVRPGGVFNSTHTSVASLIGFAYEQKGFQIVGGPDWIRKDLFTINAKAAADAPVEQVRLMVQSLLEDRFKLVTHTEQREMRVLALVLARADGNLGPYIRRFGEDCNAESADEAKKQFPPRAVSEPGAMMTGRCGTPSTIADLLTIDFGTPVLDKTGLSGKFVYDMRYEPDERRVAGQPMSLSGAFTAALADQLGFKLQADRGPIDVLVIDSVQQPTEN